MKIVKRGKHKFIQLWDKRDGSEFLCPVGVDPAHYLAKGIFVVEKPETDPEADAERAKARAKAKAEKAEAKAKAEAERASK